MPVKPVFKLRGLLVLPPVLFAALCYKWEFEKDTATWAVGGTVFLAAVALRVWAQCHLHYRLRMHKLLTTAGPYRYSRNPIYVANTMLVSSMVWLMELPWLTLPTVVWCVLVYSAVIRYEEKRLRFNFGDAYARYVSVVPRWLGVRAPSPREFPAAHLLWGPALRAEAHCGLFLLLPVVKEMLA